MTRCVDKVCSTEVKDSQDFHVGGCSPVARHVSTEHELLLRTCCQHLQASTRSLAWILVHLTALGQMESPCRCCPCRSEGSRSVSAKIPQVNRRNLEETRHLRTNAIFSLTTSSTIIIGSSGNPVASSKEACPNSYTFLCARHSFPHSVQLRRRHRFHQCSSQNSKN